MINFSTLFFNPMGRMNEIYRYSSVYQENQESLSEHITDVSIMSYLIASNLINEYNEEIDLGKLLAKCLFHDIDEVVTGDVPRNTKYALPSVKKELNIVADKAVKFIEDELGSSVDIYKVWSSAKDGKEGFILSVVDMLCVAKKCLTEVVLRNNLTFLKVTIELEDHLRKVMDSDIDKYFDHEESSRYIYNLVNKALIEIVKLKDNYYTIITKYHIKDNIIGE